MMTRSSLSLTSMGLCAAFMLTGCPDEEPGSSPGTDQGGSVLDMPGDMPPGSDKDMMPDISVLPDGAPDLSCTPASICPEDACGMVDDGCGGQLACEPCACTGGVPSAVTCGTCGLGRNRCEGDEVTCDVPSLDADEIRNCLSTLVYVDASYAGFSSGSSQEPFKTLEEAFTEFGDDPFVKAYILKEGNYEGTHFVLPSGVSIIGGYGSEWTYQPNKKSVIKLEGSADSRSYGILIDQNNMSMTLENIEIQLTSTGDGSDYVTPLEVRSSSNVTLTRVETLSLNGVAGFAVNDGQPGSNGPLGIDAQSRPANEPTLFLQPGLAPLGPENCLNAQGGNGGRGGSATSTNVLPDNGGAPLTGARTGGDKGTEAMPPGRDGANGVSSAGTTLAAPALPTGEISWFPVMGAPDAGLTYSHSKDGAPGAAGADGGGGTGGGGGYRYTRTSAPNNGVTFSGGAGGSGGSGGCGGKGGEGGQGGGSSYGLVLVESPTVGLEDSTFQAQRGGNGAQAGRGGTGGRGGAGGLGTFDPQNGGGNGGKGGDGQAGAPGAPGAGGYSVGIVCSTRHTTGLDTVTAIGSVPGLGAQGIDSQDKAPTGQTAQTLGCN